MKQIFRHFCENFATLDMSLFLTLFILCALIAQSCCASRARDSNCQQVIEVIQSKVVNISSTAIDQTGKENVKKSMVVEWLEALFLIQS